jgi:hypothetical protein
MNGQQRPYRSQASAQPPRNSSQPQKTAPSFLVTDLQPLNGCGNLRAFASVRVGGSGLTIHKLRLIHQNGQAAWVAPPQESWQDRQTGDTRYKALLDLPDHWKKPLADAVLVCWERFNQTGELPQGGVVAGGEGAQR